MQPADEPMAETSSVRLLRERLKAQRASVLRITELLTLVKSKLKQRLESTVDVVKLSDVAKATGMHPALIDGFLKGATAICSGKRLTALVAFVDARAEGEEIVQLGDGISERMISISCFGPEVVEFVFDLFDAHAHIGAGKVTFETFASAFGEQAKIVQGILNMKHDALDHARDESVRDQIMNLLIDDDLRDRVFKQQESRSSEHVQRLRNYVTALTRKYQTMKIVSEMLGFSESTLRGALRGESAAETYEAMIAKAVELLGGEVAVEPVVPIVAKAAAVTPTHVSGSSIESVGSADALFDLVAGKRSPQGVKWVLGPDVFRELKIHLGGEMVEPLCRYIEIVRALLNLLAQCDNEELKRRAVTRIGPELEELWLAVQLFSAKYPNQLTELNEERRQTWAAFGANQGTTKPTTHKKGRVT